MRRRFELLRRHAASWAPPLVLLLANLIWLSAFGSGARLRAADLERRLGRAREEQTLVRGRLDELQRLWIVATENQTRVETLYRERFSTERARLTRLTREVKDLATRAGLEPQTISYPEEKLEDFGLARRSFVFSVEGGYAQLRTFLHLVELSPSFLTVEEIRVGERAGGVLGISLRLSTLFALEPETATAQPEPAGAAGT